MRFAAVAAAALLIGATPLATHADAVTLFRAGNYAAAAEIGRVEHTPRSLAIAARAELTRAAFMTTDRAEAKALVLQGENDADAALRIDPASYDALFQRGSGIGYRATLTNSPKLAGQAHALFEQLAKSDPQRVEAWLGLGAWNGEAVDQLGRMMASIALGAKVSAMDKAFETAERLDPRNPIPFTYHGCLLLRIDADSATRARALLEQAARIRPREAVEATAQRGGNEVLALLARGDVKAARLVAKKLGSFSRLI